MTDLTATQTVQRFLDLLEAGDAPTAITLLTDDIEWRNSGLPTVRGRRVTDALLSMERRNVKFRATMHHIAETTAGDVVLTDRTDFLGIRKFEADFWVCGTFTLRDGQIAIWDDHYAGGNVLVGVVRGLGNLARR